MSEQDALSNFDFNQVSSSGLFIKFRADVPLTLRILTTDPIISESEFTNKQTGEVNLTTKFSFIVYNWTEEKAQILSVSPTMARKISDLHRDPDFGADIRKLDIKIMPTGEGLERRYDLQVLPKAKELTKDMVAEASKINLDTSVKDSKGRMSVWKPDKGVEVGSGGSSTPGHDAAKAQADKLVAKQAEEAPDPIVEDIGDEPINLDDIPF